MHRETRQRSRARNAAGVGGVNVPAEADEGGFRPAANPNTEVSNADKCRRVARLLRDIDHPFGEFAVAVCYGDSALRSDNDCILARNSLYQTDCLARLLKNSHHPPLPPSGGGRRPAAGTKTIDSFAQGIVETKFAKELETSSEEFTIDDKDLANVNKMKGYSSKLLRECIQNKCPTLFNTLRNLADRAIPEVKSKHESNVY
ncbi:hypothetical protein FRC11_000660, partial [Ceratobasidium sp. 423]